MASPVHKFDPMAEPSANPRLNPVRSTPFAERHRAQPQPYELLEQTLDLVDQNVLRILTEFTSLSERSRDNGQQLERLFSEIRGAREDDGVSQKLTGLAKLDLLDELPKWLAEARDERAQSVRFLGALGNLDQLKQLDQLQNLAQLSALKSVDEIRSELKQLNTLSRLQDLDKLQALDALENLSGLDNLAELGQLSKLTDLEHLKELQSLAQLEKLGRLSELDQLGKLKDISQLQKLDGLNKLQQLDSLEALQRLEGLENLEKLKDLNALAKLDKLDRLDNLALLQQLTQLDELKQLGQLDKLDKLNKIDKIDKIDQIENISHFEGKLDSIGGEVRAVQDHLLGMHKTALADLAKAGELRARVASIEALQTEEEILIQRVAALRAEENDLVGHTSALKSELAALVTTLESTEARYDRLERATRELLVDKYKGVLGSGTMAVLQSQPSNKENTTVTEPLIIPKRQLRTVSAAIPH